MPLGPVENRIPEFELPFRTSSDNFELGCKIVLLSILRFLHCSWLFPLRKLPVSFRLRSSAPMGISALDDTDHCKKDVRSTKKGDIKTIARPESESNPQQNCFANSQNRVKKRTNSFICKLERRGVCILRWVSASRVLRRKPRLFA